MPDSKITALTSTGTGTDPAVDPLVIVDVSDTTMAATGTTKKVTLNQLLACSPTATLASATITGDLTVRTTGLTTTASAVGINTASPSANTLTIGANRFLLCSDSQSKFGDNGLVNGAAADGNTQIQFFGSKSLFFNEGVATRMTLNATGLGVGVSPDFKFAVNGTQAVPDTTGSSTTNGSLRIGAPGTGLVIDTGVTAAAAVYGWIQARARTDYSSNFNLVLQPNGGNVGIGVAPSAWNTIGPVLQIEQASLVSESSNQLYLSANAYFASGNWNYINNSQASQYYQSAGSHVWRSATASTGAISFSTLMTLDASGNLILQSSATPATLTTNGQLTVNATSNTNLRFSYRGSDGVTRVANITLA